MVVRAARDAVGAEGDHPAAGVPVGEVHFHEVGALDAVADVTGVCYALHLLAPDEICVSTVHTGFGQVRCVHGLLPVPAPATAKLLTGIPICAGQIEGELCTPTGAALLRHCPPMQRNAGASCRGPVELGQEWLLLLHQPRHLHLHLHLHLQLEF